MQEVFKFFISCLILIFGIPLGNFLASITSEELRQGKKWIQILIIASLFFAIVSLILNKDDLMFTFLFISTVGSRSLIRKITRKHG